MKQQDNQPLVTIITVTYNAGNFLQSCIDSVSGQAYPNIEFVVIDGGSMDNTLDILNQNSERINFWKSEPDEGIYDAMNKAVGHAHGDWILFLGADDTLLPGFSEMCYKLKDTNCVYYGESKWKDKIHGGVFTSYRLAKYNLCHQNVFYPKSVFDRYKYDLKYNVCADYHLNIRCFNDKKYRFQFYPIMVSVYAHGGYSSVAVDKNFSQDKESIIKENFNTVVYLRYKFRKFRHYLKGRRDP